jgi:hypothetical protein
LAESSLVMKHGSVIVSRKVNGIVWKEIIRR